MSDSNLSSYNMLIGCRASYVDIDSQERIKCDIVAIEATESESYLWLVSEIGEINIIETDAVRIDMDDFRKMFTRQRQQIQSEAKDRFDMMDL